MRLWLSKSSEVPLREQLEAQIILGILSNDLRVGQRLPSTRELARRYKIHANTVSAAYRQLAQKGWVEFRKGSGVYVSTRSGEQPLAGKLELDQLIAVFLRVARDKEFSLSEIQTRLRHWLALQPPDHFLVIEPDGELRRILIKEIEAATGVRTLGVSPDDCANTRRISAPDGDRSEATASADVLTGAAPVTLYSQLERVRAVLPHDTDLLTLRARSVAESLQGETAPSANALIAIISSWPEFLRWARAILVAAGLDVDALSFRDARERGWDKGLRSTAFVITESVTAGKLPAGVTARVFRIISDDSLAELRAYVERFFK